MAMLAYITSFPIAFDPVITLLSMMLAVAMCGVGFRAALGKSGPIIGGAIVGFAISAMHYLGMAAVRAPATQIWNWSYVASSISAGVVLMALGMWVAVRRNNAQSYVAGALIFTLAICAMHFTGMSALTLRPNPAIAVMRSVIAPQTLAVAIGAAAFFVIGVSLIGLMFERQKAHVDELEAAKAKLETLSDNLKIALEEAESAGKVKATFFASMSHELRTPLNAIIGFSEILKAELFGPVGSARNAEYIGDIHQSGLRLLALVNDVLDMSRMDAGKMQLAEDEFIVGDMIASAMRVVEQQAVNAGVALICPDSENPTRIRGDRQRLEQALLNLLSNAIKFTPGGHVDVGVQQDAKGIQIAVEDTGIGIAERDISRILEPFVQADNRLARKYEGSGLGLAITRRLVELHGGRLTLRSQLNIGTIVTIHLPASRVISARISSAA